MKGLIKRAYMSSSSTTPSQRNESTRQRQPQSQQSSSGLSNEAKIGLGTGALGLGVGGALGYMKQNKWSSNTIGNLREELSEKNDLLREMQGKTDDIEQIQSWPSKIRNAFDF